MRTNKNGVNKDQKDTQERRESNRDSIVFTVLIIIRISSHITEKLVINDEMRPCERIFESYGRAVP